MADTIVVFTDSPDRLHEYADDEAHARFLTEELVPYVERASRSTRQPQGRCLMGASFGAVAALLDRVPLSRASRGACSCSRAPSRSPTSAIATTAARCSTRSSRSSTSSEPSRRPSRERVFVSCGMYESLIYENRSLVPLLMATGMQVRYVEARDGHNWENWRDRLREGLSWLFPGPFMIVYE